MSKINGKSIESCKYELNTFKRLGVVNSRWVTEYCAEIEAELEACASRNAADVDKIAELEEQLALKDKMIEVLADKCLSLGCHLCRNGTIFRKEQLIEQATTKARELIETETNKSIVSE